MWEMKSLSELNVWKADIARKHMPSTVDKKKHWEQLLQQAQHSIEVAATQDQDSVTLSYDNFDDCYNMSQFLLSRNYICEIQDHDLFVRW